MWENQVLLLTVVAVEDMPGKEDFVSPAQRGPILGVSSHMTYDFVSLALRSRLISVTSHLPDLVGKTCYLEMTLTGGSSTPTPDAKVTKKRHQTCPDNLQLFADGPASPWLICKWVSKLRGA